MWILALFACQSPPPAPQAARIPRLSVLEQRSGWHLDDAGQSARDPAQLPGSPIPLFDGTTLEHWRVVGDASFTVDDHAILAQTTTGKANAFLVSKATLGDFLLTLELKNELPGNSGIQIRSHVEGDTPPTSDVAGYQIEIDPSTRSWSGGLYEERGRGWLQSLETNERGRKAFRPGEWNRYRIECVGPWIRAWVNDVPTADAFDAEALTGILGLQVHSGAPSKLRFRNLALHSFGAHAWSPLDAATFATSGAELGQDFSLRLTRAADAPASLAGQRLCFRGERKPRRSAGEPDERLLRSDNVCWSIDLDDPRLASAQEKHPWRELTVHAYADRVTLQRDHQSVAESRTSTAADGAWVWIEAAADEARVPFLARVERLEPVAR